MRYRVTRDVPNEDPYNWLGRAVSKGEEFDEFTGVTYGCCDDRNEVALENPRRRRSFFGFPRDAVEIADP